MAALDELVGESSAIVTLRLRVQRLLERVSKLRRLPPILIQGETGTGKTQLARLIHRAGPRADGPFVDINCAAIPETMLESELFGHERGAFTDAKQAKPGLFQAADGGVLFLDEIGLMPMTLQPKFLTALDEGTVRRLGSTRNELVNVAVIAATNENLQVAMRERRFREDLYSRLAVVTLHLTPLRERTGDVELLAERFLARACDDYGLPAKTLGPDARAALRAYGWPENVRELRNVMERVALEVDAGTVTAEGLGLPRVGLGPSVGGDAESEEQQGRDRLIEALERTGWNISRTAGLLGITRKTVRARIQRYGLRAPGEAGDAGPAATGSSSVAKSAPVEPPVEPLAPPTSSLGPGLSAPQAVVRWDRRRVTLLRAQIISDAELPLAAATRVLVGLVEKVRSFGGRIEEMSVGGLIAAFGLEPDEEAARRAAHAGLAIVKGFEHERAEGTLPPELSIGVAIHVARMFVADVAGTVAIEADAKRQAWAILEELVGSRGEGLAVSDGAALFLGRHFEIVRQAERGRVAARLVGRAPGGVKFAPTGFLGRDRELALLQGLLEHATEGRGQLVSIIGAPGIGKSRLVREFVQGLAPDVVALLKGQCLSYAATVPYHLVLDVLRDVCGVQEGDPPDAIEAKARAVLERMGAGSTAWAPYVLNLLCPGRDVGLSDSVTPQARKDGTFEALQQLVLREQERRPLVLVLEDLHWIDRMSEELLTTFSDIVGGTRILLVCTSRPGHQLPWSGRSNATQIALAPLPAEESRDLLESILTDRAVDPGIVAAILDRAEGNPFFLEELVRSLRDEDDPERMRVPETVHDVLGTRILRLPDVDRRVLQAAAVIGRDVPTALLESVCDLPAGATRASRARLQAGEFLYPTRLGADAAFSFNHTLTWDVAYDSMLGEERGPLHARVVDAIEKLYPVRLGDYVERLAEHAARGSVWDKAVAYARQAGVKAVTHSAYQDAASHFARAAAALAHLPESGAWLEEAIDVRLELRGALLPLGQFDRMVASLREAEELARRLGDARRAARVGACLTDYYRQIGEHQHAVTIGQRALQAADESGELSLRVSAGIYLGFAHHDLGQYRQAGDLLAATIALIGSDASQERFGLPYLPAAHMRTWLSLCLVELGEFDGAIARSQEAVGIATQADHPASLASAHVGLGRAYLRRGLVERALPELERAADIGRRWSIRILLPMILEALGSAYAVTGKVAEALPLLQEAVDLHASMRGGAGQAVRWSSLSTVHLLTGRIADATEAARRALEFAEKHGERGHRAYALHALAAASLRAADLDAASRSYRGALAICEELGMRPLAARCHLGLATLLERSGDAPEKEAHRATARRELQGMEMEVPVEGAEIRGSPAG